ncbi:beta-propeller domain-containing protein, partial [Escherichia coli]|uniref:beta-propeller domain-containing protein n=1 Tax=Escherichia coli TaxID=562 RepID=UPI0015E5DBE3
NYTAASMLTIYTLDLTDLAADADPVTVAADGDTVYASATSLYLASNPQWYCCGRSSVKQDTQIHRFDITGSKRPTYLG